MLSIRPSEIKTASIADDLIEDSVDNQLKQYFPYSVLQPLLEVGERALNFVKNQQTRLDFVRLQTAKKEKSPLPKDETPASTIPRISSEQFIQDMIESD